MMAAVFRQYLVGPQEHRHVDTYGKGPTTYHHATPSARHVVPTTVQEVSAPVPVGQDCPERCIALGIVHVPPLPN